MYTLYIPVGGHINYACVRGEFEYDSVFSVKADSLEEAFRLTQNDFNEEYASLGLRSSAVGDIFMDVMHGTYYMVNGIGFVEVPSTVVNYIDWDLCSIFHEYMAQQMLDHPEDYGLV